MPLLSRCLLPLLCLSANSCATIVLWDWALEPQAGFPPPAKREALERAELVRTDEGLVLTADYGPLRAQLRPLDDASVALETAIRTGAVRSLEIVLSGGMSDRAVVSARGSIEGGMRPIPFDPARHGRGRPAPRIEAALRECLGPPRTAKGDVEPDFASVGWFRAEDGAAIGARAAAPTDLSLDAMRDLDLVVDMRHGDAASQRFALSGRLVWFTLNSHVARGDGAWVFQLDSEWGSVPRGGDTPMVVDAIVLDGIEGWVVTHAPLTARRTSLTRRVGAVFLTPVAFALDVTVIGLLFYAWLDVDDCDDGADVGRSLRAGC